MGVPPAFRRATGIRRHPPSERTGGPMSCSAKELRPGHVWFATALKWGTA
jgi:hypothetical protein